MILRAYHLLFESPLHAGREGIGQERIEQTIRSDTLWGALAQQWSLLFEESPADLAEKCPFLVSSCFPLVQGHRFYPLPATALDDLSTKLAAQDTAGPEFRFKDIKKIRWVSEPLMQWLLDGNGLALADLRGDPSHLPRIDNKSVWFAKDEQRPRHALDPLTGSVREGEFFYCTDTYFAPHCGLFFLLSCEEKERERFEAALMLLGDNGLGGDRSIGKGRFRFERCEPGLRFPTHAERFVLLSLYHPRRGEVLAKSLKNAAYTLVRRSGYAGACTVGSLRRADIWMLGEGSVLPEPLAGDIPQVIRAGSLAPHAVYRYGRALTLPMAAPRRTP